MGECGDCESSVYQGHASDCKYRCKVEDVDGTQCEGPADRRHRHGVYVGEEGEERWVYWQGWVYPW